MACGRGAHDIVGAGVGGNCAPCGVGATDGEVDGVDVGVDVGEGVGLGVGTGVEVTRCGRVGSGVARGTVLEAGSTAPAVAACVSGRGITVPVLRPVLPGQPDATAHEHSTNATPRNAIIRPNLARSFRD